MPTVEEVVFKSTLESGLTTFASILEGALATFTEGIVLDVETRGRLASHLAAVVEARCTRGVLRQYEFDNFTTGRSSLDALEHKYNVPEFTLVDFDVLARALEDKYDFKGGEDKSLSLNKTLYLLLGGFVSCPGSINRGKCPTISGNSSNR